MKVHTDKLTRQDIYDAASKSGVEVDISDHGSRSRARAFNVRLYVIQDVREPFRRRPNSGAFGASGPSGSQYAAHFDEWGQFIALLLDVDPDAICGQYAGRDDFNRQTRNVYVGGTKPTSCKHCDSALKPNGRCGNKTCLFVDHQQTWDPMKGYARA